MSAMLEPVSSAQTESVENHPVCALSQDQKALVRKTMKSARRELQLEDVGIAMFQR